MRLAPFALALVVPAFAVAQSVLALDVSGTWEVAEEERTYRATVDAAGNGHYTWQNGIIFGSRIEGSRWSASWRQSGNDREGGFTVELSADGNSAKGRWWYTRVGTQIIPDPDFGGDFSWQRVSPSATPFERENAPQTGQGG